MPMENTQREEWGDIAKGIGIVLVVLGHVLRGVAAAGMGTASSGFVALDRMVYSFHMPLFFFVAGWFCAISLARNNPGAVVRKRIGTVVWPYVLWSVLQGSVEVLLNRWTTFDTTWAQVGSLAWMPRGQFWFLYVLFIATMVLAAGWRVAGPRCLPVLFAASMLAWSQRHALFPWFVAYHLSLNLPWFLLGTVAKRFRGTGLPIPNKAAFVALPAWIICQLVLAATGTDPARSGWGAFAITGLGIAAAVGASGLLAHRGARLLGSLGRFSMGIYLMHILVGSGIRILLRQGLGIDDAGIHLVFGTVGAVVIPWGIAVWAGSNNLGWLFEAPFGRPRRAAASSAE